MEEQKNIRVEWKEKEEIKTDQPKGGVEEMRVENEAVERGRLSRRRYQKMSSAGHQVSIKPTVTLSFGL